MRDGLYQAEFCFSDNYYCFKLTSESSPNQTYTLNLPICKETLKFIKDHTSDLDRLAQKLLIDKKKGELRIQGFSFGQNKENDLVSSAQLSRCWLCKY